MFELALSVLRGRVFCVLSRFYPVKVCVLIGGCCSLFTLLISIPVEAADRKKIAIVESVHIPMLVDGANLFVKRLAAAGYVDGETADIVRYNADGDQENAAEIFDEILAKDLPDLVVTVATLATIAAREALENTEIPQLFIFVGDPVSIGFIPAVGETSEFLLTGISHEVSTSSKLDMARKTLSNRVDDAPLRLGLLHSSYPSSQADSSALLEEASNYSAFTFIPLAVTFRPGARGLEETREDVLDLLAKRSGEFDALWIAIGPEGSDRVLFDRIVDAGHKVFFVSNLASVEQGAVFTVLSNSAVNVDTAVDMADQILLGVGANEIPIAQPTQLLTGVNLSVAEELDFTIPFDVLRLARSNVFQ